MAALTACAGSEDGGGEGCRPDEPMQCPRGRVCVAGACVVAEADAQITPDARPPRPDADGMSDPDADLLDAGLSDAAQADVGLSDPDADLPDMGPPDAEPMCMIGEIRDCGRNVGRCRAGRQRCMAGGMWGPCEGEVPPEDEVCNGADDDCNGVVDDGFEVGEPCEGLGRCGAGVVECRSPFLTRCSTEPGGTDGQDAPEQCDELDNDCDGRTDEGFDLAAVCMGQCGQGTLVCFEGGGAGCSTDPGGPEFEATPEVCDGADDDCDGEIDEGLGLGEACMGVGACGAGINECGEAGEVRCSVNPGGSADASRAEVCNSLDDDCDGAPDEGFGVGVACMGQGACGPGETECNPGGQLQCSTDPGGSQSEVGAERCNDADDDCDGRIDEGLGLGLGCGVVGACPAGELECGPNDEVICSTRPGGSMDASAPEACDAIDNDCDGHTDEGFNLGSPCDGVGACGEGIRECNAGAARCSTDTGGSADASGPEICDGIDNDCDGAIDEGRACGGETCLNAPALAFGVAAAGNTLGLVNDYARSTCLGDAPGPDQIFRFESPGAETFVVGVAPLDGAYDPLFWVSDNCDDLSRCLSGRDAGPAGLPEARLVAVPRSGTFYIAVDGRAEEGGPFAVSVRPLADGETCDTAIPLTLPGRFVGTTERPRTNDVASAMCPPGRFTAGVDQIFRISAPRGGRLIATVTPGRPLEPGQQLDPVLSLFSDCARIDATCAGGAGNAPPGQPERLDVQIGAGDWFLAVDHEGNLGGPFLLEVELQ